MKMELLSFFLSLCLTSATALNVSSEATATPQANSTRTDKFLSLMSLVRFSRSPCYGTNGYNGTCLTALECSTYGGIAAGSCAIGFGVCCTILITSCGSTATVNNTYWQNYEYSNARTNAGQCTLYITTIDSSICQIRLDFLNFTIANPDASSASSCTTCTQCVTDSFTAGGQSNNVPPICGNMKNQHMYLSLSPGTSLMTLNMLLTGTSNSRIWNIRISQIPCGTSYTAPDNCLQWFTDATGSFSSFNYLFSTSPSVQHLANQDYTICIRVNYGYCGICYQVCDTPSSVPASQKFLVSGEASATVVDAQCFTDFIQIPCAIDQQESTSQIVLSTGTGCVTKICGSAFSAVTGATTPALVYSYRRPFEVRFYTDSFDSTTTEGIGFCLKYTQQPCVSLG